MELKDLIFHGNLEHIKKLEIILKKLSENIILHKIDNKPHSFFDTLFAGNNTVYIYPRHLSEELIVSSPVQAVCDSESVGFSLDNANYRIFFDKKYSEK